MTGDNGGPGIPENPPPRRPAIALIKRLPPVGPLPPMQPEEK